MTTKVVPGQLVATFDADHVAREASTRIARALRDAIAARGSATIALSGGNTPRAAYERLAKEPGVDWSKVEIFWIDERAVPPTDERSNYRWAKETLLDRIPLPPERAFRMPADSPDLEKAAREYDALLRTKLRKTDAVPSFDVIVLGVGDDGHTASLFPGEPTVDLTDRLVAAVPAKGDREARLTVTAPVIENTRAAFILAVGKVKQAALERVWSTSGALRDTPARVIRSIRGGVTWVIDKSAGGLG